MVARLLRAAEKSIAQDVGIAAAAGAGRKNENTLHNFTIYMLSITCQLRQKHGNETAKRRDYTLTICSSETGFEYSKYIFAGEGAVTAAKHGSIRDLGQHLFRRTQLAER